MKRKEKSAQEIKPAANVNRPKEEVRAIPQENVKANSAFAPISIRGEWLSETVLRERR